MARDNIELVDRDYSQCSKKAMPRQIRTRDSSFRSILKEFRRVLYENKMNKEIDKTLSTTYTEDNIEDKLMISSERIAALENKIRRLSMDDVPTKNVERRAIKLRNHMMDNTLKNAAGFYMVDLNKDEVLGLDNSSDDNKASDDEIINSIPSTDTGVEDIVNVDDISSVDAPEDLRSTDVKPTDQIDLTSDEINTESIRNTIDEEFNNVENANDKETTFVSPEEVSQVVGNNLFTVQDDTNISDSKDDNLENEETNIDDDNSVLFDVVPETVETASEKSEDILPSISTQSGDVIDLEQDAVTEIKPESTDDLIGINIDDIKDEIDSALGDVKVSKSESSIAKVDKFDENGDIRFKDSYTPMADDEIAESQEKINSVDDYVEEPYNLSSDNIFNKKVAFDNLFVPVKDVSFSFENKYDKSKNEERDIPIVVSERKEDSLVIDTKDVKPDDNDDIAEYTFDVIENTDEDTSSRDDLSNDRHFDKIGEINRLKDKLLELKKKKTETNKNMAKVQLSAVEVAKRAEAMKKKAAEVNGILDRKVAELRSCCESLEKNNDETIKEINLIENDIQMNNNFIQYQEGQLDKTTRFIDEIDNLISGESRGRTSSK